MKKQMRTELIQHIKAYSLQNDIYLDTMNGIQEHLHSLISLHPTQVPAKVVNLLKGESSNWVNKNDYLNVKFAWQEGYSVFSVGASQVAKVRTYINDQGEHHKRMSFQEEVEQFLRAYRVHEVMP